MRIFTSSWFHPLPSTIQKIGVSRGTPRGYPAGYRKMPELAPGPWFKTASERDYKQLYFDALARLDPGRIVAKMEDLSAGKDCALLCYEAPTDNQYCHRAYISVWLKDRLGLEVFEYGLEAQGCAWQHPKLPAQYRQREKPQPLQVAAYLGAMAPDAQGRTWTVIGVNPEHVDQALVQSGDDKRSISVEVLQSRFQPVS
ncbi:hypothetical protein [Mesorhizobium sp. M7A.F.Ca.MR.148.00.0.0]|uniref:DUF488 family protein, N3 subclade n=1 Tax=Mesorhizobium sp. M7A.F.Ca.MR.148.00.0.0 TaxID=2496775 RepID=UPI000FCB68BA|nr:hypothetical protein [Mesorhizobium sp. M7A.F.Ca.MR.148.00.0.0]RUV37441.1 hypothetical protein EOB49_11825 [Mesorhizobium sp. M7A.F.Ca.MR.148.00.0.0]